ncbi:collagen alpha-1(XVII) chain-like isoform X2 [Amphibalanus amphitrite]|uniref:collagen alpha-1(XVII) chain-like isoform X2 n=1 Tax=Amphibalanus amphitrite TaxID=1232801 RepID=UPI001C9149DC|nr:collagen alpha-1(XVII) chain-like isoform X2 [Amphibalanus amphitrite]
MSSLTRSEYRHEEQRRVTESPFRETKWDRHLDTLLTDLNESVGAGRPSAGGSQQRSVVPSSGSGLVTERQGVAGSGDFHERREYTSPDQRTHVVEERFEKTARGDGGVPGRLFISNRYQTNNGLTTNRWPTDHRRGDYGPSRPAHDLRSPDAVRCEPNYGRTEHGYGRSEPGYGRPEHGYGRPEHGYGRPEHGYGRPEPRSPDGLRSEPDYARGYDFPRRGRDLPDDLRSEPDYAGTGGVGGEPEPWLWRGRTGSVRSVTSAPSRQPSDPFGRRPGSARAPGHGRRSPPYAEVYRSTAETYRSTAEPPYRAESFRGAGEPHRGAGEPHRGAGEPYRGAGEPYRSSTESYGYSRPYQPPSGFASALSPVQPTANRPSTNDGFRLDSSQSVTKQVYKTSSYSGDNAAPQTQPSSQQQGDPSRFKQNILELDSLLDDLDHARKKPGTNGVDSTNTFDGPAGTSTPYRHTNIQKTTQTSRYTSSGPGGERQPTPGDQLTTLGLTGPRHSPSPNPLDGLDRGLVPELSEPPVAGTTRVTKYEYRSSNRRDVSPQPAVAPAPAPTRTLPPPESARSTVDRREYTSATSTLDRAPPPDTTDKTTTYVYSSDQSTLPPGVPAPPVPAGSNTTINYHIYNYGTLGPDGQPVLPPGVAPPPGSGTLPRREVVTSTNTSTSSHQYRETSPPAPRSPAPGPDTTVSNSYVFEKHTHNTAPQRHPSGPSSPSGPSGPGGPGGPNGPNGPNVLHSTSTTTKHYTIGPDGREIPARPASPYDQQYPKFPVDDGPGPQGHHTRTTTTTIERTQTRGSPFPARSPSPSARRPQRDDGPRVPFPGSPRRPVDDIDTPRRVDELMAQIPDTPQDGTYPRGPVRRELNNGRSSTTTTHFTVHETEPLLDTQTQVTLDAKSGAVVPQAASKPVSGPPIYYPPGSTEFKPKPESEMMFQSYESRGGGKYASGYKAKGKYKAKAGSKETHAEGGAVIPICLPLCCGAACSVM